MEVLKAPEEGDKKGEEIELCLELSIGGRYGKTGDSSRGTFWGPNEGNSGASRPDFSCCFGELEAQKFKSRIEDRKIRERDGSAEELVRKKDKNLGTEEVGKGLNLSLFTENRGVECSYPEAQHGNAGALRNLNSSVLDCEPAAKTALYGSLERSSSAASDYHSTTQKGGNSTDTAGSHSSHSPSRPHACRVSRSPAPDHLHHAGPPHQLEPSHRLAGLSKYDTNTAAQIVPKPGQTNTHQTLIKESTGFPVDKPPKASHPNPTPTQHMPCVTTTGNGPNGKTIAGFLYKYSNAEVVIMCVCHGWSFNPAEFVQHAGGVDVSHPLRHITVVPSPFAE